MEKEQKNLISWQIGFISRSFPVYTFWPEFAKIEGVN